MPTYVYKFVDTGETVEVQQAFDDPTLTEYQHPESGDTMPVKKVFTPVGVTFKGSGFFKTDNRGSSSKKDSSTDRSSSNGASGDSKQTSGSGKSGDSASSSSDSSSGAAASSSSSSSSGTSGSGSSSSKSSSES